MSSTEALVNYVHPKKEVVKENFLYLFTQNIPTIVDGVEMPLLVTCMPIIQAPAAIVHDFVLMTYEHIAPNGLILASNVIGNPQYQPPKE